MGPRRLRLFRGGGRFPERLGAARKGRFGKRLRDSEGTIQESPEYCRIPENFIYNIEVDT